MDATEKPDKTGSLKVMVRVPTFIERSKDVTYGGTRSAE